MSESNRNLRIVVDTNLIISAEITATGNPARVLDAWREDRASLFTSPPLTDEVSDVLTRSANRARYRFEAQRVERLLAALRECSAPSIPLDELPIHCRDPKDDAVLACALANDVDYIVTGDDELLSLDGDPALGRLRIVTPRQFLALLGEREESSDR